jgi:Tfp pilus assembly protein PilV
MSPKHSKANSRYKGLSIIEVAMASALLIVAMVPILKSLTKANMLSSEAERKTQCLILAQGKLDELKARSIYHFDTSFTASNAVLSGSYLCNVTDTTITANLLKQVTVSVGYDDNHNGSLADDKIEVTLSTYFAKRSL